MLMVKTVKFLFTQSIVEKINKIYFLYSISTYETIAVFVVSLRII